MGVNLKIGVSQNGWFIQWLFLVPLKGGRDYIIPQLAVYTTYLAKLLYFAGRWVEFGYFGSEIMVRSLN